MANREPHWVKLFLRELERTGNVRLAAERAGVDFATAYQRRKRHAEFAERWAGALLVNRQAALVEPLTLPSPSDGALPLPQGARVEEVARPDGKVIRGSEARWGKRAEERFLTELTVSGSVRRAASAAGFSTTAIYKQRAKSRRFMAAWDTALETGKARVQAYLVEAATRTFDPDELPIGDDQLVSKVSISEAIHIAKLGAGGPSRGGKGREDDDFITDPITREEWQRARENIVGRLERLRENMDREERETGRCRSCGQELPNLTLQAE